MLTQQKLLHLSSPASARLWPARGCGSGPPATSRLAPPRTGGKPPRGKTLLIDFTTISSVCAVWSAASAAASGGGGNGVAAENLR